MTKKIFLTLWGGIFLSWISYAFFMYARLPEEIATHFDVSGQADGWGRKDTFFSIFLGVAVFLNLVFLFLHCSGVRKIPTSLINLPWKEYWFANEERKAQAYQRLELLMAATGVFLNTLFLMVLHMVIAKSFDPNSSIFGSLFLGVILGMTVGFLISLFYLVKPPRQSEATFD